MRSLLIVCVVACLALTVSMASAASPGQISDNTLAQMGLAGMHQMSDAQGTAVRGKAFPFVMPVMKSASVWGSSFAAFGFSAAAPAGYTATGPNGAQGISISAAGLGGAFGMSSTGGNMATANVVGVVAIGASRATAW
jgi:hypothetical protein